MLRSSALARLRSTNAAMSRMRSKLSTSVSCASTSILYCSSMKLIRPSVASESRMPLVRSGVSSRRFAGDSPGQILASG